MGNDRRVRRLVVDGTVWHWTVRQQVKPDYADCRLTLSFFTEPPQEGARRRLSMVFAPGPGRVVSHSYFEKGTVVRLCDRGWLNLYEPGTARRLLDAAAPVLRTRPREQNLDLDGWPCFDTVLDAARVTAGQPTAR
ncbi:hypothetical protein [Streptomyces cupreus]|uniref:Uncharacterized protein n=1 Tax=Streptomyces cupreus TaxID=2759956 RepID=A0A7X1IX39_9ACTN|nr:hypothetical protein [Streptomyces cupreus]MBC2900108.1 hypothetical protein [Streptomyces cupreus]